MIQTNRLNLILGGGGVKGIAYIGAFEVAEKRGITWGNIAGVSAGALAGAYLGAGYKAGELRSVLGAFDLGKIEIGSIPDKVPIVARYMESVDNSKQNNSHISVEQFVNQMLSPIKKGINDELTYKAPYYRENFLQNIITFAKEGCLFDGDYLERWVERVLARKGVKTFGDMRGGIADRVNPCGYKVRMTAVDVERARVVILPDDISFYGIDPDKFPVAKAIRMSTCIPFAFKPVEIIKKEGNKIKTHHFIDGGILDGFPFWAVENSSRIPAVGFVLDDGNRNKFPDLNAPLDILKAIISAVHDTGVPKKVYKTKYVAPIDTSKVGFLDFNLDESEKEYLYNAGVRPAKLLFNRLQYDIMHMQRNRGILALLFKLMRMRI